MSEQNKFCGDWFSGIYLKIKSIQSRTLYFGGLSESHIYINILNRIDHRSVKS